MHKTKANPKTFDEAVLALDEMLNDETKLFILKEKEIAIIQLNHTFGNYIRNKWDLWYDCPLSKNIIEVYGLKNPEDMSKAILMAFYNFLVK